LDRLPEQPFSGDGSHGVPSLLSGHVFGGPLDRLDDIVVARAATEVALELVPDLVFRRLRVAFEHLVGGHDHARRAEAALEPVLLPEALLDRVQLAVLRETLDCQDGRTVGLDREHRARLHRLAAEEDRARAALARVATEDRKSTRLNSSHVSISYAV